MFDDHDKNAKLQRDQQNADAARRQVALKVRKLRWLGFDDEAEDVAATACGSACSTTILLVPPDTD